MQDRPRESIIDALDTHRDRIHAAHCCAGIDSADRALALRVADIIARAEPSSRDSLINFAHRVIDGIGETDDIWRTITRELDVLTY